MIPVNIFLIIFLLFLLLIVLFTFFNVYHMIRFGKAGFATIAITTLYLLIFFVMVAWSVSLIATADWTSALDLNPFSQQPASRSFFP